MGDGTYFVKEHSFRRICCINNKTRLYLTAFCVTILVVSNLQLQSNNE